MHIEKTCIKEKRNNTRLPEDDGTRSKAGDGLISIMLDQIIELLNSSLSFARIVPTLAKHLM